jgi:hypothetical protein
MLAADPPVPPSSPLYLPPGLPITCQTQRTYVNCRLSALPAARRPTSRHASFAIHLPRAPSSARHMVPVQVCTWLNTSTPCDQLAAAIIYSALVLCDLNMRRGRPISRFDPHFTSRPPFFDAPHRRNFGPCKLSRYNKVRARYTALTLYMLSAFK